LFKKWNAEIVKTVPTSPGLPLPDSVFVQFVCHKKEVFTGAFIKMIVSNDESYVRRKMINRRNFTNCRPFSWRASWKRSAPTIVLRRRKLDNDKKNSGLREIVRIIQRAYVVYVLKAMMISPNTVIDTMQEEEAAPHDAKEIFSNWLRGSSCR